MRAALAALVLAGCSGARPAPTVARDAVEVAGTALAVLDRAVADEIRAEDARPHDPAALQARWTRVVVAMSTARDALVVAERAADAWRERSGTACTASVAVDGAAVAFDGVYRLLPEAVQHDVGGYATAAESLARMASNLLNDCGTARPDGGDR